MTEKNLTVIRQILSGDVWSEVVNLPAVLMAQARLLRDQAPIKAAVTAQMAVAIGILTFAPVRLGNLVHIRLDENLIKPGGLNAQYMLVFPHYDVKNRVQLEFLLDAELTALIDEYIHEFRSLLLRGSNELWLFPGETGGCKDAKTLSGQVTERIEKAIGLSITVHQFRHAGAALWLKNNPGDYETVRRTLGHHAFHPERHFWHEYVGFNYRMSNLQAAIGLAQTERFDEIVAARRRVRAWYDERLRLIPGLQIPAEAKDCKSVFWMYAVRTSSAFGCTRHELRTQLAQRGIETRSFFVPMHLQPIYFNQFRGQHFPIAEAICRSGLYLPTHENLEERDVDWIVRQITDIHHQQVGCVREPVAEQ